MDSTGLRMLGLFAALTFVAGTGFAQGTAAMSGRVEDPSGATIPNTNVTVTSLETGATRTVTSDEAGNYQILSLLVGRYDIKADKTGFKAAVQTGINLVVGQQAVINLKLEVGSAAEQVTVTGETPLVNTTTSSIAGLVGEQQVKDLPLNGRSFDLLITLNPSVVNYTSMKGVGSVAGGNIFSVAGRRPNENLTLLNGVDYPGASNQSSTPGGASGLMLGVDSVREYNMLTNDYGAEFGKKAGAQVNVVTQSGTNQLHGSLFEFIRNSDLDARNFFEASIGPFKRNNFGAALGGPIRKNKTFLFGNYEGLRQRLAIPTVTFSPDTNARLGLLPCGSGGPTCVTGTAPGTPTQVAGLDKRILPYFALWPVPTNILGGGIGQAFGNPSQSIHQDFGTARIDQTFSGKDTLSGVYTIDDGINVSPGQDPLFGTTYTIRTQIVSMTQTHIFSPTVINTVTAGFSRAFFHSLNSSLDPALDAFAFVTGKSAGAISLGSQNVGTSTGLTAVGSANPDILFRRNLFTYTDGIQVIKGKHQFSFGAWFQRSQSNDNDPSGSLGQATFTNLTTMLQGTLSAFKVAPAGTTLGWRAWLGAWYAQDSIQVRPNLTLRIGLRHEFSTAWSEVNGRAAQEVFVNGVMQTDPVVSSTFNAQNNSKWLLEPRISLAWDPFGKGKTSIRAGFGTYHDMVDELFYLVDSAQPFNAAATFPSGTNLFSVIPISRSTTFPPTCGPGVPNPCSIYSPHGIESNYKIPTNESWTFTLEQQLSRDMALRVGYLGFQGYHAPIQIDPDQIAAQICTNPAGCLAGGVSTSAATRSTVPQGGQYVPIGLRPNQYLASGIFNISAGNSNYNALQVDFVKRLTRGLQFRTNYTWSRSFDMGTALTNPTGANSEGGMMDITNFRRDWSPSNLDVTHQVSGNMSYELPIGQGKAILGGARGLTDKLVGGWQVNSIVTVLTGFPITALIGSNQSGTGNSSSPDRASLAPGYNGNFTQGVTAGCTGVTAGQQLGTANRWFDPCAFVSPAFGTFGNTGRNIMRGPHLVDWDLSLLKNTHITERTGLQFRAEFFNLLNHTNLGFPAATVGTPSTAGVITRTSTTSRQIQFSLKLMF